MNELTHTFTPANHYAPLLHLANNPSGPGERADWQAAFNEWARCQAIVEADMKYGPFAKTMEAHEFLKSDLIAKHGREFMDVAEARTAFEKSVEGVRGAEEAQLTLLRPLWAAQRKLLTTPAPDMAAVAFKHELTVREELSYDANLDGEPFDIIADDIARLAGEAA